MIDNIFHLKCWEIMNINLMVIKINCDCYSYILRHPCCSWFKSVYFIKSNCLIISINIIIPFLYWQALFSLLLLSLRSHHIFRVLSNYLEIYFFMSELIVHSIWREYIICRIVCSIWVSTYSPWIINYQQNIFQWCH